MTDGYDIEKYREYLIKFLVDAGLDAGQARTAVTQSSGEGQDQNEIYHRLGINLRDSRIKYRDKFYKAESDVEKYSDKYFTYLAVENKWNDFVDDVLKEKNLNEA